MKKNGFALVLTLWIVAMMSLASVLYLSYAKKIVHNSRQLYEKLTLTFKAESTIELLKFYGSTGAIKSTFMTNTLVQKKFPTFPKQISINSKKIVWDNTTILLEDTGGLIDISDTDLLSNYIKGKNQDLKGKEDIIKDSIEDWLDENQFKQLNGAEDLFYQNFGYESRDRGYFASPEELFLLKGFEDFNETDKDDLLSLLVMTDSHRHNILTLKSDLLQSMFSLSMSDVTQLKHFKKSNDLVHFMSFFHTIYKENYDLEADGALPSKIVRVTVNSKNKNIHKEIVLLIDFNIFFKKYFQVLNYKD